MTINKTHTKIISKFWGKTTLWEPKNMLKSDKTMSNWKRVFSSNLTSMILYINLLKNNAGRNLTRPIDGNSIPKNVPEWFPHSKDKTNIYISAVNSWCLIKQFPSRIIARITTHGMINRLRSFISDDKKFPFGNFNGKACQNKE